jgi:hypothetical protein
VRELDIDILASGRAETVGDHPALLRRRLDEKDLERTAAALGF